MPKQQSANNAADIAANAELINHLVEIGKMYGWVFTIIVGLLVYTWYQKEKTQDKLEKALISQIKENDIAHGKLFDELRATNHKVDEIVGAHDERAKKGGSC